MKHKIKCNVMIDLKTNLEDVLKPTNETIKYLLEEDLQDMGYDILNIEINSKHKNYIFGIISSIIYCYNNYNEGAAKDLYNHLLQDFNYNQLKDIIKEIDSDLIEKFNAFYEKEIQEGDD